MIKFNYNEAEKKLKINKREGNFKGMKKERVFKITKNGTLVKTVNYKGEEMEVDL